LLWRLWFALSGIKSQTNQSFRYNSLECKEPLRTILRVTNFKLRCDCLSSDFVTMVNGF
jgi:hypothetical protein